MSKMYFNKSVTPMEILQSLKDKSFSINQEESLEDYLTWLAESLWKFQRLGLQIPQNVTLEEKCSSVVDQLITFNLLELTTETEE